MSECRAEMLKQNTKDMLVDSLLYTYSEIDRLEKEVGQYAERTWIEPDAVALPAHELAELRRDAQELVMARSEIDWLRGHVSQVVNAMGKGVAALEDQ